MSQIERPRSMFRDKHFWIGLAITMGAAFLMALFDVLP